MKASEYVDLTRIEKPEYCINPKCKTSLGYVRIFGQYCSKECFEQFHKLYMRALNEGTKEMIRKLEKSV